MDKFGSKTLKQHRNLVPSDCVQGNLCV